MKTAVYRKAVFNSAHRLHRPEWDEKTNDEVFGKCNNPSYHGHNYELILKVVGDVDPVTGFVMDTKVMSDIMKEEVLERFDHKNLNLDTVEFKHLNPTAENIARVIYDLIRPRIESRFDIEIILYETPRNFVSYPVK